MKFTIRDLLWLTVVVALATAWGVNRHYLWATIKGNEVEIDRLKDEPSRQIGRIGNVDATESGGLPGGNFHPLDNGGFGSANASGR